MNTFIIQSVWKDTLLQSTFGGIGNKPIDGGFYLFDEDEMRAFIYKEPQSERFFGIFKTIDHYY